MLDRFGTLKRTFRLQKCHFNVKFALRNLPKIVNIPKKEHDCLFHCEKNITSVVKKGKIYGFFVKCLKFFMSRFRSTGFSSKFPNFL